MDWIPLTESAARQVIDSTTTFIEFRRVRTEARRYIGGMYWKRQGAYEYLTKTLPDNRQSRIGARSPETEKVYADFTDRKQALEARLRSLRDAVDEAERLNRAVKAGRVPSIAVAVLRAIDEAGLEKHFTVVGTHALYAYEAAAGVRIVASALATRDVDLLWDARQRVRFVTDLAKHGSSILDVLRRADKTFERKEGQNETAINAQGFEVDFLRRQPEEGDPHPFRFSDDENDLWPVQALRAGVLTNAPRFEHVVISVTGRMALMRTVAPADFAKFKRWMGERAPNRPEIKRGRDKHQADIVQALLDGGLLIPQSGAASASRG